jgi:hypothetical protein
MMGMRAPPERLFYDFCLEERIPADHLLRRIDRFLDLSELRATLRPFYSRIGRPSIALVSTARCRIIRPFR